MKDYYYILGVHRDASNDEIKNAYRKLSMKFHPDHNNGDKYFEERFREVNEAYTTLNDELRRKVYDILLNKESKTDKKTSAKSTYTPSTTKPVSKTNGTFNAGMLNFGLVIMVIVIIAFVSGMINRSVNKDALENYHHSQENQSESYLNRDTTAVVSDEAMNINAGDASNTIEHSNFEMMDTNLVKTDTTITAQSKITTSIDNITPSGESTGNTNETDKLHFQIGYYKVNGSLINKIYFHNTPNSSDIRNAYFTSMDDVYVQKVKNGFGYVEFTNSKGKLSYGWLDMNYLIFQTSNL